MGDDSIENLIALGARLCTRTYIGVSTIRIRGASEPPVLRMIRSEVHGISSYEIQRMTVELAKKPTQA